MSGRPEGSAGGYDRLDSDDDAQQDFVPWRPGDPSTIGEAPSSYTTSTFATDGLYRPSVDGDCATPGPGSAQSETDSSDKPRGRWWTEGTRRFGEGDKVRATRNMGSGLLNDIYVGAKGTISNERHTAFGGRRGDVTFENGREIRNVPLDGDHGLERRSWLD